MSVDEFLSQLDWPGVQPSPSGGGGTSAAQEPEPTEEDTPAVEDDLTPPEPFLFASNSVVAHEEVPSPEPISEPSPTPISEDTLPSAPALEQEQPISQDPPAAPVLDLNEHAEDHPQED